MFARLKKGLVLCEFVNRLWSMVLRDCLWMFVHSHHHRETFDFEISAIDISKPNVSPWWQIQVYRQTNPKIRHRGLTNLSVTLPQAAPKSFAGKDYCVYGPGERYKNHMLRAIKGFMVGEINCKPHIWYMWHCSIRCGDKMASYGAKKQVTLFLLLPRRKINEPEYEHTFCGKNQYSLLAYFGEYYIHVFLPMFSFPAVPWHVY